MTKVLVFVEENHSLDQMKAGMPYLYSQAVKYGYASNYKGIMHPSLPNYLALFAGDTFGIADDNGPASHPISPPSVFDAVLNTGRGARSYQEGMTSNCQATNVGRYAVKHNAWAYLTGASHTQCLSYDIPSGTVTSGALRTAITSGVLPNVGTVTPDLCNDAHDCSLAIADNWLMAWLQLIYTSPDWKSGHLAVIVTADEDNGTQGNLVLTTVIHPSQNQHVVTTALNHYSLNAFLTQVGHAPCIRNGCSAASFAAAFGLTIG